ncbi:glycosyltransferase family 2 protein [Ammoniphilus sp. 3BR4]|uniref:glycosyltransferase family 2 protein n=1 Tax=Ammoniphilus sp. 3BR4 TaxID=3158265 RepID=UPI003465A57B
MPEGETNISVVIPTYNALIYRFDILLAMLKSQKGFQEIEVIVVDSGSSDGTVQTARKYGAKVINIPHEDFSHSYSRNRGGECTSHNYILFITQDALPPTDSWLFELFSFMQKHKVAAVSCSETPREDADLYSRVHSYRYYKKYLGVVKKYKIWSKPKKESYSRMRKRASISNIACLLKKEIFMEYHFRHDYAEDLDLGLRLIRDGKKIALQNQFKIIHSHNRTAYYHLKRGYIDTISLSQLFSEYQPRKVRKKQLCEDIAYTLTVLNFLATEVLEKIPLPCSIESYFRIVEDKLHIHTPAYNPHSVFLRDHPYCDSEFQTFLKSILAQQSVGKEMGCDRKLLKSIQNAVSDYKEYMLNIYRNIDYTVSQDFNRSLFKEFANQIGKRLASGYIRNPEKFKDLVNFIKD